MATGRHRPFGYDEKVEKLIKVLPNCNGHETGCRAVSFSTLYATSTRTFLPAMEADAAGAPLKIWREYVVGTWLVCSG